MLTALTIKYILFFCKKYDVKRKDCREYMYACINPDLIGQYNNVWMEYRTEENMFDHCSQDFIKQL